MSPPLVSVIMPARNAARWLPQSLDSVLAQTYPHREIIVVDDGSTDETAAVLEAYRCAHGIRVLTQPTGGGQSRACNRGLAEARGQYVKFFDADDVMSPNMLETQVAALDGHPGCLAFGIWGRFYRDPAEAVFKPHPGWHDADSGLEWIVETWADTRPMYQCALWLLPRELLARVGGWDERLSLINDFEFFTRLVLNSRGLIFTPDAHLYYRSNLPGSLSAQKTPAALASCLLSCQLGIAHLLAREDSPRTRRVSADILRNFSFDFHPTCPQLASDAERQITALGGSAVRPGGGRLFRLVSTCFGWPAALSLRHSIRSRPALRRLLPL